MKKVFKASILLFLLASVFLVACGDNGASDEDGIKVGVLFSRSGSEAVTENGMANAALMAIEEINEQGGVNGKKLIPIEEDIESSSSVAAEKIRKVIMEDEVIATVGAYTSAARQAMLPIVEQNDSLLLYPTLYEGEEYSKNIIYTGATPNQQLQEFVPWLLDNEGKKFFFIGNDYVYPVQTNNQVKELLKLNGGQVVGEEYVPLGHSEFSSILNKIKKEKPDVIFSDLVGSSVAAFYSQYKDYGFKPAEMPIASPIMAETDIEAMGNNVAEGHITSFNYFQSVATPENEKFVKDYHDKYGQNEPITAVMQSSYVSVYLLKEALEKAGDNPDTETLVKAFAGIEFNAPEGTIRVDEKNNHTWLHSRIGRVNQEGQFEILVEKEPIKPEPWSELLFPDHPKPWEG